MDIRSRVMQKARYSNSKLITLDMTDLSSGFYIVQLKTEDELMDIKVIKR